MTHEDARDLCAKFGIVRINAFPCQGTIPDWNQMDSEQKERVLNAADWWKYRKPKNANGSRGRYFADYLRRILERG
ncbi:hypothetical protein RCMRWORF_93 [Rhodobacter phage RcMrWorf]|nr:hypothetical protein RCMRWORF_93 [Rhodobacter phage RcMrWorf]